jgi:hypothetical protein
MAATSILEKWEVVPNTGLKVVTLQYANTVDAGDTCAITLADHGISATGLLIVEGWVQTTDGSVVTKELNTCAVSAGVLTVTIVAGTNNDTRVIRITGRANPGVFV